MPGPSALRTPRYKRLTYTNASLNQNASDLASAPLLPPPQPPPPKSRRLRLRPHAHAPDPPPPPPLAQRSVTTLGDAADLSRTHLYHQRALSASSLPTRGPYPPHALRSPPPPPPPARRHAPPPVHPAQRASSAAEPELAPSPPPLPDDAARRARSGHRAKPTFPYARARARARHRAPSSPSLSQLPYRDDRAPSRSVSGPRAVYNATTASAKAAALASSRGRVGYLVPPRDRGSASRTHEEESTDLSSLHLSRDDSSYTLAADRARRLEAAKVDGRSIYDSDLESTASNRATRIVVKRRVIRGTSSWRLATEDDIDEYLQGERHREMQPCRKAEVNVPPSPAPLEDTPDMDALCSQCANPLTTRKTTPRRGVRRVSSLLSRHLGLDGDCENSMDITEMAAMDEYKAVAIFLGEVRKCRKEMYYGLLQDRSLERTSDRQSSSKRKDARKTTKDKKYARDLEKFQRVMSEQRSMSADDPAIMRALLRQDQLQALVAATRKKVSKKAPEPAKNEVVTAVHADPRYHGNRERSQSELALRQKNAHPEARTRVVSCLSGSGGNNGRAAMAEKSTDANAESPTEKRRGISELDDDEDCPLRILTAIEPVDPSIGFEDSDPQRGTSYHTGFPTHGYAGSRRRVPHRSSGDSSLLRRFRSLRRRPDDRY